MWTYTHKINVDGWEALEIIEGFGQTKSTFEGSMVEGYMVYQTMVYISQYSPTIEKSINVLDHIWDVNSKNKFELGEHLLGKGRMRKVRYTYILGIYTSTFEFFVLFISYLFNL